MKRKNFAYNNLTLLIDDTSTSNHLKEEENAPEHTPTQAKNILLKSQIWHNKWPSKLCNRSC